MAREGYKLQRITFWRGAWSVKVWQRVQNKAVAEKRRSKEGLNQSQYDAVMGSGFATEKILMQRRPRCSPPSARLQNEREVHSKPNFFCALQNSKEVLSLPTPNWAMASLFGCPNDRRLTSHFQPRSQKAVVNLEGVGDISYAILRGSDAFVEVPISDIAIRCIPGSKVCITYWFETSANESPLHWFFCINPTIFP